MKRFTCLYVEVQKQALVLILPNLIGITLLGIGFWNPETIYPKYQIYLIALGSMVAMVGVAYWLYQACTVEVTVDATQQHLTLHFPLTRYFYRYKSLRWDWDMVETVIFKTEKGTDSYIFAFDSPRKVFMLSFETDPDKLLFLKELIAENKWQV